VISAVYGADDPTCCPTSFLVREISFAAGQWWTDTGTEYSAASAPTVVSDL